MNSFSQLVLSWMFGRWIFDGSQAEVISDNISDVTPLTIFAAAFSQLGLLMFGVLASWAMFLGIFRLKNNGNFFGAKDGNEAFFYPLRVVVALILVAPVVPVSSAGGVAITLTTGHALISGVSKMAAEFGDTMQHDAFELMHRHNLFNDPKLRVDVDPGVALDMLNSWKLAAAQLAGFAVFQDPSEEKIVAGLTGEQLALVALRNRWNEVYGNTHPAGSGDAQSQAAEAFLSVAGRSLQIPLIAPTDSLAREVTLGENGLVDSGAVDETIGRELETEGWFCQLGWMSSMTCSDEFVQLKVNNAASIEAGISSAQRQIWIQLVAHALQYAKSVQDGGVTQSEHKEYFEKSINWTAQSADWYSKTVEDTIANTLAGDQAERAEPYFDEVKSWGWMLGGTFVLRAASDFSRAASYAEGATSKMMPKSSLSALTGGEVLSKVVEQETLAQIQPGNTGSTTKSLLARVFSLDILKETTGPSIQNIHTIAAWGRSLVGTGIGFFAGGKIAQYMPGLSSMTDGALPKSIGALMIIAGGMIGYVMPLLFAVYGLMGAIGWLVAVATTFFGVTLWSAGFAAPKGEEHTSQMSAKGWNALIFIGLYPALAVGGLAAAIVISAIGLAMVQALAMGMWGMFDPGTAEVGRPLESLGGILVGGLLLVGVIILVSWNVVVTSAQLIMTFPRTVLNMISFSEPGLNPYENSPQNLMGGLAMSARQVLTGAVSRAIKPSRNPTPPQGGG
ncbi:hypothetical protein ACBG90_08220 [Stutzerimonas kunmingensis]|jgi:hypothetical protein|uniref:Uncharacterized protein n=2 Tax=Stutzerimonas stutzeri TaxID=316 RepID=A0A4S2B418_STUST|nr:hypothetical protein [Stutzerimonas stutzeri]MBI8362351.1 hypothetical protein [Pseudomonas aeruginosa]NMY66018.1 hypothetical protein [Pseudomonas sp. WS 5018]MCF0017076.1 hypothetical protein [Stutzerimonas stutzeri]MCF0018762.1 hypothetical protein [Stutzerimonas stutzeri]MDH0148145.1 hypothetical protein [Stutzerimonas stutzeri]